MLLVAVNELDVAADFVFGKHVVFIGNAGNVVNLERVRAVFLLLRSETGIQMGDSPEKAGGVIAAIRLENKVSALGINIFLDAPQNVVEKIGVALNSVAIFDDAAGSNVGHGESFRENFRVAGLYDQLVDGLAREINYFAVGMNCARADIFDVGETLDEWNFDVGVLLAFFGENLDAVVIRFG